MLDLRTQFPRKILLIHTSQSTPSHISIENHVPSVLEAFSAATTDGHPDLDAVEIVTHNMHHSATAGLSSPPITAQTLRTFSREEMGNTFGNPEMPPLPHQTVESSDVRRLSFVSFADVINNEHAVFTEITSSCVLSGHLLFRESIGPGTKQNFVAVFPIIVV